VHHGGSALLSNTTHLMTGERPGSHSPLRGHASNDLRPSARPHFLKFPLSAKLGVKPLIHGPLGDTQDPIHSISFCCWVLDKLQNT
jgi:hypothetical protein